jgi:hypothetical protein
MGSLQASLSALLVGQKINRWYALLVDQIVHCVVFPNGTILSTKTSTKAVRFLANGFWWDRGVGPTVNLSKP